MTFGAKGHHDRGEEYDGPYVGPENDKEDKAAICREEVEGADEEHHRRHEGLAQILKSQCTSAFTISKSQYNMSSTFENCY